MAPHTSQPTGRPLRLVLSLFIVLTVLALFPWTNDPAGPVKIFLIEVFAFVGVVLLFAGTWLTGAPVRYRPWPLLLFGLLLFCQIVTTVLSAHAGYCAYQLLYFAGLFLMFLCAAHAYDDVRGCKNWFRAFCGAMVVASAYGLLQHRGIDPFPWGNDEGLLQEAPATFGNPNLASHALVLAFILAAGLVVLDHPAWIAAIVVYAFHFSLTRTRSSLAALVCAMVLVMVALAVNRFWKKPRLTLLVPALVVLLCVAIGLTTAALVSLRDSGTPFPYDRTLLHRYHSFYGAARMIQDRPVVGRGPGAFALDHPAYWTSLERERFTDLRKVNMHVHNELLELGVDSGLGSAVIYLAILIYGIFFGLWRFAHRSDRDGRVIALTFAAFCTAFLLDGLLGFNLHAPVSAAALFMFYGMAVGALGDQPAGPQHPVRTRRVLSSLAKGAVVVAAAGLPIIGALQFYALVIQQRGLGAQAVGAIEYARTEFARAAAANPYDWKSFHLLGVASAELGDLQTADRAFGQALEQNPYSLVSAFAQGKARLGLIGRQDQDTEYTLDDLRAYAGRLEDRFGPFPETRELLGRCAYLQALSNTNGTEGEQRTEWAEAARLLQDSADRSREAKTPEFYYLLASAYEHAGDIDRAERSHLAAIETETETDTVLSRFYEFARRTDRFQSFLEGLDWAYWRVKGRRPEKPELQAVVLGWRARVLVEEFGDADAAETACQEATTLAPNRLDVWSEYARFALATGRYDDFRNAIATRFTSEDPPNPPMTIVQQVTGQPSLSATAAVNELQTWLDSVRPTGIPPDQAMGLTVAVNALAAALVSNDEKVFAKELLDLVRIAASVNDQRSVLGILDKLSPSPNPEQQINADRYRGLALLAVGRADEAAATLAPIASRLRGDLEVRMGLARALAATGKTASARFEYGAILQEFSLDAATRETIEKELAQVSGR